MARKTFISYKYSDAKEVRNRIIKALGEDAAYYKGEDGYSDDLSSYKADTIKKRLKDMIYGTSVTILVISPEMLESKWISWELEYSLKNIKRNDRSSRPNGIVSVIKKVSGDYSWIEKLTTQQDGCKTSSFCASKLPSIVNKNRYNQIPKQYSCEYCHSIDSLTGSYISIIEEDEFLNNPQRFIENAYEKSCHLENYDLKKTN